MLKRKIIVLISLFVVIAVSGLAVDKKANEIVKKCAKAMGINEDIKVIVFLKNSIHGKKKIKIKTTILRPNQSLKVGVVKKGNKIREYSLLFNGKKACYIKNESLKTGLDSGPEIVPENEWWHFEWSMASTFPAFFDNDSEYLGISTLKEKKTYLLRVKLPLGTIATYHIDEKTYLPLQVILDVDNSGKPIHGKSDLIDYRKTGEVLLSHSRRYYSKKDKKGKISAYHKIIINPEYKQDDFKFPSNFYK